MFGGRPSLRSAQKGHTTFLDPETLSLLRSGPRNRWEGLLIGDCVIHSKLKTGVKSTRKSRAEMLRRLAETVLATSGSQPRIRWETGIPIVTL